MIDMEGVPGAVGQVTSRGRMGKKAMCLLDTCT